MPTVCVRPGRAHDLDEFHCEYAVKEVGIGRAPVRASLSLLQHTLEVTRRSFRSGHGWGELAEMAVAAARLAEEAKAAAQTLPAARRAT